jgi:4-hydroxy-tetrahydrodipicolinate synthase
MINQKLKGTGVALVTPFNQNGEIDFEGLGRVIDHSINGGVEYLVSLGTTGESVTLSKEEKKEILKFTVAHNAGRVPVVAGFGGNNTVELIRDITAQDFTGIDAILSVSPYYNKPTQQGILAHYKAVAVASPLPILLYNVPGRTGSNIAATTALQLAREEAKIIGIKEASGDFTQAMQLVKNAPDDFLVISGDDNITLGLIAYGFHGVISVVGQAFPTVFSSMVRNALAGDFAEAKELHYQLNDITDMLFAEGNPGGVKYALELQGICQSHLRLPLVGISDALKAKMKQAVAQL